MRFAAGCALVALYSASPVSGQRATVIDSTTLGGESARTLSEALTGRVIGVTVLQSSGVVGTGSRVRMRGGSGLLIPRAPLLVVDGIRVDDSQSSLGIDIGGQSPSRLDDIPLDDIERIEVLRGPATSALYGADAAGGVIVVTTKRGTPGGTHWSSYVESGVTNDATAYPANSATGPPSFGENTCTRAGAATGTCVPGPFSQWNPLEQASPFRSGIRFAGGVNASGGSDAVRYYVGGAGSSDQGPLAPNDVRRYSGRANVDVHPVSSLRVSLGGSHVGSRTTFPLGDTYPIGTLYSGLLGNTADDPVRRGYYQNDVATIAGVVTHQRIERSLGSLQISWSPVRWLTAQGLTGREIMHRDDEQTLTMAAVFGDPTREGPWRIALASGRDLRTTIRGGFTATYSLGSHVSASTTVTGERLTASFRVRDSTRSFFEDGTPAGFSSFRSHSTAKIVGWSATEQLTSGPRQLSVGVRRDDGDRSQFLEGATYWSASTLWNLSRESFFHRTRALSDVAVRATYGVAGDTRPIALVLETPPSRPPPNTLPGAPPPPLPSFTPEKVSELEIGLDMRSFTDRLTLGATWYRQRSTSSYERGCCVGPFFFDNKGKWHTNGIELSVGATLLRTPANRLDTQLTFAAMANRYDGGTPFSSRLLDIRPFLGGARRYLIPGHPIAGVWARPVTGRDANGDGVIVPAEISRGTDSVYMGSSIPTRQAGLAASLTVLRWLTLSAQADYVGGFTSLNETEAYRCGIGTCLALYDPNASTSDQTRAVAGFGQTPGFHESGDFVRLRELAVTWVLAPAWSHRHGFDRLALTIAGRNFFMSTDYSGLDPEVNTTGQSSFGTTELFTLPVPRAFIVRLAVQH